MCLDFKTNQQLYDILEILVSSLSYQFCKSVGYQFLSESQI